MAREFPARRGGTRHRVAPQAPGPDGNQTHAVDPIVLIAAAVLVLLGALNLTTIGMPELAERHLAMALAGGCLLFALARLSVSALVALGWVAYAGTIAALVAVSVTGDVVNGAKRWLDLGAFTLQPSEIAKLSVLIVLAAILGPGYTRARLAAALAAAALPAGLVMLQPDLSTALVLAVTTAFVLILARVPALPLVPLFAAAFAMLPLAGVILRPYQMGRVDAFLSGERDASGPGWSMLQAEIAVGTGGLTGQSGDPLFELRTQYLPERQHDLAFAALIQGWGLLAAFAVVLAVVVLVWRAVAASRMASDPRLAVAAAGVGALLGVHLLISVAGNLNLLPHTGLPMPLFSYGGTTMAVHVGALGLLFAARRNATEVWPLLLPVPNDRTHPRLVRLGALTLSLNLAGLGWFSWQVQEREDELRTVSDEQMTRCVRLPAERGVITDRHGVPLVANADVHQVRVVPGLFDETDPRAVDQLADLIGQSPTTLGDSIDARGDEFEATVATVPPKLADRVTEAAIPGVLVGLLERREYPYGDLLGPLLGFVGVGTPEDMDRWPDLALGGMVGRGGLEQQYDAFLRGRDGRQCLYVDPRGRPVAVADRIDPVAGTDVALSLDLDLQKLAHTELGDAIAASGGDLGGAVVMDPRTGAVLAMVTVPSYDNSLYGPPVDASVLADVGKRPGLPMINHVTQVAAPPGSTFKLVVAAANAAGSYDQLSPSQVIAGGASYTYGGHTFGNWQPLPPHNLRDAIAWSNNVYFYELARRLGPDLITTTADALGVGRRTGIDLPGESPGFLGTPDSVADIGQQWYGGSTILLGIGQGPLTTTPLQVARWTAGVATGAVVTPQLGMAFGDSALEIDEWDSLDMPLPETLPFADELDPIREGMRAAVTGGTASGLAVLPVSSAGKTGSAEDNQAPNGQPNSWFTAYAPYEDPEVVVTVFVRGGGTGSGTSGPVAREIIDTYAANLR